MKALLEEYGEALVACIIACLLIPFMLYAVKNFYKNVEICQKMFIIEL